MGIQMCRIAQRYILIIRASFFPPAALDSDGVTAESLTNAAVWEANNGYQQSKPSRTEDKVRKAT